jgi:hypothetical protein
MAGTKPEVKLMYRVVHPDEECHLCEQYKKDMNDYKNISIFLFSICFIELLIITFFAGSYFL